MSPARLRSILVTTAVFLLASVPAFSDSQVRAVRLSYVEGGVQIAHADGKFDKAMVNLPITQDTQLLTNDDARAEVEFEDGSTMRIAPNSSIEFPQLALRDSGAKASYVEVTKGTAYVDFSGEKKDEFVLQFGKEKISLERPARLRIEVANDGTSVAVFKGEVEVEGSSATLRVKKNQTGTFEPNGEQKLVKDIEDAPLDAWDKQQSDYHVRYASNSYTKYSPYAYGTADLAYYGNFFNAPGYGMCWQPYFVGMGWDPFMDGAWSFYPGSGFGWVSAYPWGWVPYHYGTWAFVPGYGWAWQPGGVWSSWHTAPHVVNPPSGFKAPMAPTTGTHTVIVSRGGGPTTFSGNKVVIRSNSAGLGVPRGQVDNLAKASNQVQKRGTVTERVHTPAPAMTTDTWEGGGRQAGRASGESRSGGSRSVSTPSSAPRPTAAPRAHPAPAPMPAPAPSAGRGPR
jgi:FecR protein